MRGVRYVRCSFLIRVHSEPCRSFRIWDLALFVQVSDGNFPILVPMPEHISIEL